MGSFELGSPGPFPLHFLKTLFTSQPKPPTDLDLTGQTWIITGGYTGIGHACAETLLKYKLSHLIITARNESKATEAITRLQSLNPTAKVEAWILEMLSYDSIQAFIQRCKTLPRIDCVILNAAVATGQFVLAEQTNHESTFQVNYLSTALLTILVLPLLREKKATGKPPRITIVSSALALVTKFAEQNAEQLFPAFDEPRNWQIPERYNTTKLLLLMFVAKLTGGVNPDEVVINCVEPGLVRNRGLDRNAPFLLRLAFGVLRALFARSVEAGAWTYIDAAALQPGTTHGSWILNWAVHPFPKIMHTAHGKKVAEKLWDETVAELEGAGVRDIISSVAQGSIS
ncbi:uncharacterized protein BDV17DRAFT_300682 [Aspergillus undulatus]|uniref:uncharacterized protein n=1 Tax=Aspergillus undulatus TaxID=1810928 RepID=UPI003CCDD4B6